MWTVQTAEYSGSEVIIRAEADSCFTVSCLITALVNNFKKCSRNTGEKRDNIERIRKYLIYE